MKIPGLEQQLHRQFETRYGPSAHWSTALREQIEQISTELVRQFEDQLQQVAEAYDLNGMPARLLDVSIEEKEG